jgi:hypothetical protein
MILIGWGSEVGVLERAPDRVDAVAVDGGTPGALV